MDPVDEKELMLSRTGSFWYRTLSEDDRKIARTLTSISCRTRINRQVQECTNRVLGGGYYRDSYRVLHFTDKDVFWMGMERPLQARTTAKINDLEFTWREHNLKEAPSSWVYDEFIRFGAEISGVPTLFPRIEGEEVVFPGNYRVRYCLHVDKNAFVESIRDNFGRILTQGTDFISFFGSVWFKENPLQNFPDFKIATESVVYRVPNLYSYTLQLDDVYGPVDRVVEYYRSHQSVKKFYLAAAQAGGFAVIREDCCVKSVAPLLRGVTYIMDDGSRYDAPYTHKVLPVRTKLKKDDVIGGLMLRLDASTGEMTQMEEMPVLFGIYGPADAMPGDVSYIKTGSAFPVCDLIARNAVGTVSIGGTPYPALEGAGADKYKALLGPEPAGDVVEGNVMDYVRNTLLKDRCVVVRINEGFVSRDTQLRLDAFIRREAPLGVALTYSPITSTI